MKETVYCHSNVGLDSSPHKGKTRKFKFNIKSKQEHKLTKDENNNNDGEKETLAQKALQFKYTSDAPRAEIEHIRKLIALQRDQLAFSGEEWDFFKPDYDRMMVDDWLVTRFLIRGKKASNFYARAEAAVNLGDENADNDKQSIYTKTMDLIEICARFRYQYRVSAHTRESDFPPEWTKVNGMFHYRQDRAGNPIAYLRVALHKPKLIETEELRHQFKRYMLYVLEQCDQRLFKKPGKAICCVFDLSNVAFENIDLDLTTWMIKSLKDCAPKLLGYVIIYNPPWFFTATFKLISNTLLSNNKRQSVKFAHGDEILDYVHYIDLPPYLRLALM